jgi:hypothetical protein
MSNESEVRELYANDPLVGHELFGRMIEDAQARDRLEADAAEAPEPEPDETVLRAQRILRPALQRAAGVLGEVTAAQVGEAILRNARRFNDDDDIACPRCSRPDVIHVPGHPECKPADDAPPEVVARYILAQFEQVAETLETIAAAIAGLNALDGVRADDAADLRATVAELTRRMDLRVDIERVLTKRLENMNRVLLADRGVR